MNPNVNVSVSGHMGGHVAQAPPTGGGMSAAAAIGSSFANAIGSAVGAFEQTLSKSARQVLGLQHGKISLQLDQPSYVGGDVVSGTVHLAVYQPFAANAVFVNIYGYEMAKFETVHTESAAGDAAPAVGEARDERANEQRRIVTRHDETREFFRERLNVWTVGGAIAPGNYNFPFQYRLPDNLPGVYSTREGEEGSGNAYRAEILYIVEAKFDVAFTCNLYDSARLIINEKFDRELQPSFSQDSKTFMFTSGRLTAKCWLDHNCYFPGNSIVAKIEANNTSVKATESMTLSLYSTVHLKAHNRTHTVTKCVGSSKVHGFEPSFFGVRFVPFRIPLEALPTTTSGRLVRNEYHFDLVIQIPRATNLHVRSRTAILAPQFLFSNAPPSPPPLATVPQEVSFRPPWQPDNDASTCKACGAGFSLFKRRHHCRHCGLVHCDACTKRKSKIANLGYDEMVRVCDACYDTASKGGSVQAEVPEFGVGQVAEPAWSPPPPSAPE